ncbi:Voltage-dependent calcium channel, alpha-1 subunit [Penicillium griseofulvum]|uniref:Calcium-channel protein CCH1 n=1 Tax=Penicillium patulum TaxID=5078 RepID=A0A135LD55_PENPA|nr:Voltage-dependent calcium channel, alpha-1 subunit [Penicillium griseofulvum]KXG46896.1 Voltage-dependent calcium channel, alpha-1 subunit [Penicillium griseofulvum]
MMAPDSQNLDNDENAPPNQIPLQDLSKQGNAVNERGRSRAGTGLFSRQSLIGRGSRRNYESVAKESPIDAAGPSRSPFQPSQTSYAEVASPVDDLGGFAQAMSSVGLSFNGPQSRESSSDPSASRGFDDASSDLDVVPLDPYDPHDPHGYNAPGDEDDRVRLTDPRYLQPMSGAANGEERNSTDTGGHSVHFGGSRLGDDLPHLEDGMGSRRGSGVRDRSRSLSPSGSSGALQRAGSMVKSMSQRVVNLSNEPEVVQQSIEREELDKNARMDGPPVLPAMVDYAFTSNPEAQTAREKRSSGRSWRDRNNPFRGRSLGILGPNNPLRLWLCDILVNSFMEPFILIVIVIQTILLTVENSLPNSTDSVTWGSSKFDWVFFAIFIIYTLEICSKILVSGLILNPVEYSTLNRNLGIRKAIAEKGRNLITPHRQGTTKKTSMLQAEPQTSILRTFTGMNGLDPEVYDDPLHKRRIRLAHRAFLRHSFNRLDFVAVIAFWISFFLSVSGVEQTHQLYIFRMLSCLRILRLLAMTNGTSVILRSLKRAAPLLVHVAFLISFFWLLFAIIGVQSFKSSLKRTCVWMDPAGKSNYTLNDAWGKLQFCGGHLDRQTGKQMPWIGSDGESGFSPKGYICPQGSVCMEGVNPYNGTMSFDNIVHSLELVFVIMSSNTFSDLLYYTTDTDYLPAALFFACGFVILSLWLVNLLVAVITHSFQVIREESKRSAFAVQKLDAVDEDETMSRKVSPLKRIYDQTEWVWVCLIIFDLIVQALRSSSMSDSRTRFIDTTETVVTIILLVEIILRFASDWRMFHRKRRNLTDLLLVVITCIIQLPPIRNSGRAYTVLTLFQILRVYRVVLAFSVTRKLILIVFSNIVGLLNLIFFLFLMTFLSAIFATQLFRSQIPEKDPSGETIMITFSNIYNSFLGMYQILSSEDWTTILYNATAYTNKFNTAWISASFIVLWFIVSNFIILNMFIAVIQESFDVSEDEKRMHQVRAFLEQKQVHGAPQGNLAFSKILRMGRDSARYKDPLDHGPAALEMLLKDAVVQEFLEEENKHQERERPKDTRRVSTMPEGATQETIQPGWISLLWTKASTLVMRREPNPFYSKLKFSRAYEELDPTTMAREVVTAAEQRKRDQRAYLVKHPNYNKSLFIFPPDSFVRKLCQRIVGPGRGHQRVEGVDPYKPVWYAFSAFIYAAIVAMVLLACITTPLYQRQYLRSNRNWFVYTDLGFAVVFTIEATIKVIADGFFWTPNAFFRSSWGFIDGLVLITLWVSVGGSLNQDWSVSRAIGAFKALRALRLLNVSDSAKNTFHSVIIVGGWKVIAAAAVSMSFLIPFAIYGVNLFNGQMASCNDGDFSGNLVNCVNEYSSSPYKWDVLAPRVAGNSFYDFDNFGNSLFILFQIVSQEGWVDVQENAMGITGKMMQPEDLKTPENGLFFVVFNLLGAVFVLTLFVSVFMRNYTEQTGVAFLTAEQRSWLELRKLLRQISPSKRSFDDQNKKLRLWCYRISVKKHGRWAWFVTCVLVVHLLLLVVEYYPEPDWWEVLRAIIFLAFMCVYVANVLIRLIGLGWHRFSRSSWDLFSLIVVPGAFVTSVLDLSYKNSSPAVVQLNKLFLVSVSLMLIPRNNQLDQLFKTAAASLSVIGNLLATWFVLFLVFGIAMNQAFGLTKFGGNEDHNQNFRDVPRSLILLFRASCGEGWNQFMEDFATMTHPFCTHNSNFLDDDCGSAPWARTLFIAWNLISMYIFVSLFVSLIFESFSYVYQRSSGLYAISREEIRRFKQAWATYDPDGTGFISTEKFPRLLGELSGVFAMRIYEGEFTVGSILEKCRIDPQRNSMGSYARNSMVSLTEPRHSMRRNSHASSGVDIDELSRIISRIPVQTIRERRRRLNTFYEEILVSADPDRGISFHQCLMILAHHNVISDSKSLRLEEFLRRRARLQRVDEAVRRNTVVGFFDTLYWSRQFRRQIDRKKSGRMSVVPTFTVPEIFVDDPVDDPEEHDEPASGAITPQTQPDLDGNFPPMLSPVSHHRRAESSPTANRNALPRINTNLSGSVSGSSTPTREWSSISPSITPRHMYGDRTSFDTGETQEAPPVTNTSRQNSMNVQDVMHSLDNSAWGESIRRSFTQRRSGDRTSE